MPAKTLRANSYQNTQRAISIGLAGVIVHDPVAAFKQYTEVLGFRE